MLCLPNAEDGRRGHGCRQPERGESQGQPRHATSTGRSKDPCHATPHQSNIVAKLFSEVGPPLWCLADNFVSARECGAAGAGRHGHGCRQPERGESQGQLGNATSADRSKDPCHATPHRSNIVAKVLSEVGPPLCLADDFVFARESAAAGIGERTIDAGLRRRSDLPWPQLYTCDFTDCEVENALVEHGFVMECPVCKFRAEKRQRVHRRSSLLVSL